MAGVLLRGVTKGKFCCLVWVASRIFVTNVSFGTNRKNALTVTNAEESHFRLVKVCITVEELEKILNKVTKILISFSCMIVDYFNIELLYNYVMIWQ